ncbi:carbonic anhydrase family protein [Flavobacteriales bacterium]|jgi:carbonic anhydrase|nr:carbonic anhydrase family protein [Flavobacteriales bacterium]
MKTQTKEIQDSQTPSGVLEMLKDGNKRFIANDKSPRDLNGQVLETATGQFPHAVVLSCIDSRVPVELVFDQGIGDIFSARVAGNVINEDVLGSIEYGCKVAGSKLVVVMGHTKCGAVTSACKRVELGNITSLLSKITPAVNEVLAVGDEVTSEKIEKVNEINIHNAISRMRSESAILNEMEKEGAIQIVGAVYDVASGNVNFL